jgi:predicted nicotinamide N-methyase
MTNKGKTDVLAYGIRVLRSRHSEIRRLKRLYQPSVYGYRLWTSSWLLMDFFKHRGLRDGARVMELGCGWGLAGIYCAKNHNAIVTGVDIDAQVFPYLRIHADINEVEIATMVRGIDRLTDRNLQGVDVMIGADICFWDTMGDSLRNLISRALHEKVRLIVIADPGRPPFTKLGKYFLKRGKGKVLDCVLDRPHPIQGRILKIDSL